ncbi:MAG: glycosyltransferase family 2 protein, partial [Spirochaetales bacterium]
MRFSIVVPVFNSEKYLDKCLKSLLGQSFDDYQIILVDDGSTDESGKICDKAVNLNKNVKVIHQDNKGQLAARIEGI